MDHLYLSLIFDIDDVYVIFDSNQNWHKFFSTLNV